MNWEEADINGKTVKSIEHGDDKLLFVMDDGTEYKMWHKQDCCELVTIKENESSNLIEKKINKIEETYESAEGEYDNSRTITTYSFHTDEGIFKVVWVGESNGYYSETPSFEKIS